MLRLADDAFKFPRYKEAFNWRTQAGKLDKTRMQLPILSAQFDLAVIPLQGSF